MARKKVPGVKKAAVKKVTAGKSVARQPTPTKVAPDNTDVIGTVQLTMTAELGRTRKTIESVSGLGDQSLIEFDKGVGDPIDILLNGELFARGEVVTVGENFGVRVTEVVARPQA